MYINVYSFSKSICIFFLKTVTSELYKNISPTNMFFYWTEDSKTYAHADA